MISPIEYVEETCEESEYHEARSGQGKDEKEGKTNERKFLLAFTALLWCISVSLQVRSSGMSLGANFDKPPAYLK